MIGDTAGSSRWLGECLSDAQVAMYFARPRTRPSWWLGQNVSLLVRIQATSKDMRQRADPLQFFRLARIIHSPPRSCDSVL